MQQIGFLMDFILFVVPAFHYKYYSSVHGIHAFQAMYFLSSFFNQFGPNAVTFLVAAEVYPTPVRATAHGFSAAMGKCGALLASVVYNYISTQTKFYFVPWFGLLGMLVTALFLPDTTGLDLKEQERRWAYIRAGREQDYHGVAVHSQHLSLWERFRGQGKYYDPEQDHQDRINDMRADWEAAENEKQVNESGQTVLDEATHEFTDDVHNYFRTTSKSPKLNAKQPSSEESYNNNEKVNAPATA
jgi:sugar transport protein